MWVRINDTTVAPEHVEQGIEFVRDGVLPAIEQAPGHVGLMLGVERSSGRCVLVSTWSDRSALDASTQASAALRSGASVELDAAEHGVEVFEVLVMRLVGPVENGRWMRMTRAAWPPDSITESSFDGSAGVMVLANRQSGSVPTLVVFEDRAAAARSAARGQAPEIIESTELEIVISTMPRPV